MKAEEIMIRESAALVVLIFGRNVALCADRRDDAMPEVSVRLMDRGFLQGSVRAGMKTIASEILYSAGVRLRWEEHNRAFQRPNANCSSNGIPTVITIRFLSEAPRSASPSALASTMPFSQDEPVIAVFYDRLQPTLDALKKPEYLLGHVLAHEIGHRLMSTNGHAESGLMKARWSASDILSMANKPMKFTPEHVFLIRHSLTSPCALLAGTQRQ